MYLEASPAPPLRSLVECYWAISGPAAAHRVLPDGCIDVIAFAGEGARVVGTMTRAFVVPARETAVVGVRFRPGEAARLLREAPRELTDEQAPLGDLWGDSGRALEDALGSSFEGERRASAKAILAHASRALDAALLARLTSHAESVDLRVRAAASILTAGGSVREAAAVASLSERQLARRFVERVGVAPKLFARVMRLRRATSALARGAAIVTAAEEAGYVDQPHLARDFRELALVTPAGLVAEYRDAAHAMSDSYKTPEALAS